jgi:hypothetical protein
MTSEERGAHLRRAVSEDGLPVDVRAAAALLLLYGLPMSRVARIRISDLVVHRDRPHLMIDGHRTVLPPAVDRLLRATAAAVRPRTIIAAALPSEDWLFPGQRAGLPMAGGSLGGRLKRHGFPVLTSRNASRLELAGEIPAAALSVILGISLEAGVFWARLANRDWNAFVHARATQSRRTDSAN